MSTDDMARHATGYTEFPPGFDEFVAMRSRYLRARAEESAAARAKAEAEKEPPVPPIEPDSGD